MERNLQAMWQSKGECDSNPIYKMLKINRRIDAKTWKLFGKLEINLLFEIRAGQLRARGESLF